jgi:N-acetylmuramoyl-L-alanine amidase
VRLRALSRAAGAHVVMTRSSNTGIGPCITERAAIGNRAHSDAAISIHADGGPPDGSGFAILIPAPIPSRADQAIANMQNRADEAPMERASFREGVARALFAGLERFLSSR